MCRCKGAECMSAGVIVRELAGDIVSAGIGIISGVIACVSAGARLNTIWRTKTEAPTVKVVYTSENVNGIVGRTVRATVIAGAGAGADEGVSACAKADTAAATGVTVAAYLLCLLILRRETSSFFLLSGNYLNDTV